MSNEKFEHCVKFGDFLEWECVHGNKYGTPIGPLEDALDDGNIMLLDIDVKDILEVKILKTIVNGDFVYENSSY